MTEMNLSVLLSDPDISKTIQDKLGTEQFQKLQTEVYGTMPMAQAKKLVKVETAL